MPPERHAGFTLLEVLIAVVIAAAALTMLIGMVTDNLRALGEARRELEVSQLAEARMREIYAGATAGDPPEIGTSDGSFESPHEEMSWRLEVEPYQVPLPDDLEPEERERIESSSSIFAPLTPASAAAQRFGLQDGTESSVRLVVLRVFHQDDDPESSRPFVLFTVDPPNLDGFVPREEDLLEEPGEETDEELDLPGVEGEEKD